MKIKNIIILFTILISENNILASDNTAGLSQCPPKTETDIEQILQLSENQKETHVLVDFNYTNENLINIINNLAAQQGINILFPSDLSKIEVDVTLNLDHKISLTEAWSIVNTFLEIAGFALVPRGISYEITSNKDLNKEPLATYINIHPEQLPNDDSKVRYLYYLQNINLTTNNKSKEHLSNILRDMLPGNTGNNYIIDPKSNSLIIINKTSNIKAVMNIIMSLDREGFREAIEIVPLKYTNAKNIVDLLNKVIENKKNNTPYRYGAPTTDNEEVYFSKNTSIVAIERSNAVAIMGRLDAVEKIKDFILKYLDIKVDSGKSIIHVKDLKHVDAGELATVLQKIVRAKTEGAQSSAQRDALSEVIITAERDETEEQIKPLKIDKINPTEQKPPKKSIDKRAIVGNNSIVIAAREPEWRVLEKLIDEIDQPLQQVGIETLIVDLIVSDDNTIAAQTRNLAFNGNPKSFDFQSAQMGINPVPNLAGTDGTAVGGPMLNYLPTTPGGSTYAPTPQGLASDLITAGQLDGKGVPIVNELVKLVNQSETGSTLISFSDGEGIASLLQVFSGYQNAKVLSQPFVTTQNHQQAAMSSDVGRIVRGSVQEQSVGGPAILKRDTIKAVLEINVLPRISRNGEINLEIIVHVSEFTTQNPLDNTITKRTIHTNANISDKQVLVIGGLTKITTINTISGLPIISKIPLLGNLFKRRNQNTEKSALMVFVSPKIIKPRKGISKFTMNKINEAMDSIETDELAFDNLSDPITRILFPVQAAGSNKILEDFANQEIFIDHHAKGPISSKIG